MPRYIIERDFPGEFQIPTDELGVRRMASGEGASWMQKLFFGDIGARPPFSCSSGNDNDFDYHT